MAQIGMARATELINEERAKVDKKPITLQSGRALLKNNGFELVPITPNALAVDEDQLRAWLAGGGLRDRGRPSYKTKEAS